MARHEEHIQRNVDQVLQMEEDHLERRTPIEKIMDGLLQVASSSFMTVAQVILLVCWLAWRNDYDNLNLVVSIEALFLSILVLATQRRMRRGSWRREQLQLQVALLTEQEITQALRLLREVADRLDIQHDQSASEALLSETDPRKVMQQLDRRLPDH